MLCAPCVPPPPPKTSQIYVFFPSVHAPINTIKPKDARSTFLLLPAQVFPFVRECFPIYANNFYCPRFGDISAEKGKHVR